MLNYQDFAVRNVPLEEGSQLQSFALDDFDGDAVTDSDRAAVRVRARQHDSASVTASATALFDRAGDDPPFPGNASAVAGQFNPGVDAFPTSRC